MNALRFKLYFSKPKLSLTPPDMPTRTALQVNPEPIAVTRNPAVLTEGVTGAASIMMGSAALTEPVSLQEADVDFVSCLFFNNNI